MTFSDYKKHYEKYGMCINDSFRRKNPYTEKQLITRYEKYKKDLDEQGQTQDEKLRKEVVKRDRTCRLFEVLTWQEKIDLRKHDIIVDYKNCDMAHVFNKSSHPWMRYDLRNVVYLSRIFHSRLDSNKHPITGKQMTKNEAINWWIRIVGNKTYSYLEDLAKNGRST